MGDARYATPAWAASGENHLPRRGPSTARPQAIRVPASPHAWSAVLGGTADRQLWGEVTTPFVVDGCDRRGRGVAVKVGAADAEARVDPAERAHLSVEFIEQRNASRQVDLGNLKVADAIEMLDECPQRVAVSGDQDEPT